MGAPLGERPRAGSGTLRDHSATTDSRGRARLAILLAALLFSTGGVGIKAIAVDAWTVAGLRSGVAALAMLALLPRARRGIVVSALPVGLAYAATLVLFTLATKATTAANAIFIQDIAPLWIVLVGPFLLGERLRGRDIPYFVAVAAGMACFFLGARAPQATAPNPPLGNLYALASSVSLAFALMGVRWLALRSDAERDPAAASALLGNALAFLICLPAMSDPLAIASMDWVWIIFLGTVQIALAYTLLTRAAASVPAFEMSLLILLEPILNPVWTGLVHGEDPGALAIVGGAIVIVTLVGRAVIEMRAEANEAQGSVSESR